MTCRLQIWPFQQQRPPDFTNTPPAKGDSDVTGGVVLASRAKVHNDGSISLSGCGQLLACFVEWSKHDDGGEEEGSSNQNQHPSPEWAETQLVVMSLRASDLGATLYRLAFGPNAVAVAFSPGDSHLLVGLTARRYIVRLRQPQKTVGQIYRMRCMNSRDPEARKLTLVRNIDKPSTSSSRNPTGADDDDEEGTSFVSSLIRANPGVNCMARLPEPGQGFVYGTNKGTLFLVKPTRREYDLAQAVVPAPPGDMELAGRVP